MMTLPSCQQALNFAKQSLIALAAPIMLSTFSSVAAADNQHSSAAQSIESRAKQKPVRTGRFLDSAVFNIRYVTDTLTGYTDLQGTFQFRDGETVSFYVGDILIGSGLANNIITPASLAQAAENPDTLSNILRFLQALDSDANPENGIHISQQTHSQARNQYVNFDAAWATFEVQSSLMSLLSLATNNPTLPEISTALIHFRETLLSAYANEDEDTGDTVLDLVNSKWDANITSAECPERTVKIRHHFNLLGHATTGFHDVAKDDKGVCKGRHWAIYGAMWENDQLFNCARSCSFSDLNKTVDVKFPRAHTATLVHEPGTDIITIIRNYNDGKETIETLVRM